MTDTTGQTIEQFADSLLMEEPQDDPKEEPKEEAQEEPPVIEASEDAESESEPENEGEELEAAAEETDEEEVPQTFIVKVDGQDTEVTLDELTQGFSGQKYVQKKMQENAEIKRQLAEQQQALAGELEQVQRFMQQATQRGVIPPPGPAPDPKLIDTDAAEYNRQLARFQQHSMAYSQQQTQIRQAQTRHAEIMKDQEQQFLAEQAERLKTVIPEFSDPEKAARHRTELYDLAIQEYGFSEEEVGKVNDARTVQVLHDALQFRKLKRSTKQAKKVEAPKAMNVKPSARRKPNKADASKTSLKQARKSQRTEDWAEYLLS